MQFKVPKFLEREAKIVGSLSFKQLAYFGVVALILLVLYFVLPLQIFIILFFVIGGLAFILMFMKIEGVPLIQVLPQYFNFFGSSRIFIWRKKEVLTPIKLVSRKEIKKKAEQKEAPLRISPKSKLKKLGSKLDLGFKQDV